MKPFPIISACCFIVAAGIGWQLAGGSFSRDRQGLDSNKMVNGKLSQRERRSMGLYRTPDAVKEKMRAIRSAGSPQEQMRATMALAESIPASEIQKWMEGRWFDDREGFDLTLLNKILIERWMKEDPEGFLAFSMKGEGGDRGLFEKWGKEEPQRVLQYFKNHPDGNAELQALGKMAKDHPALVLGRLKEMMDQGFIHANDSGYYAQGVMKELAKSNPAALEGMMDSLSAEWQSKVESVLIGARLASSFDSEIQKLYAREDGWKILMEARSNLNLGDKILGELANLPDSWKKMVTSNSYIFMNASTAQKWFDADLVGNGFTTEEADKIRAAAINNTSYNKPELALKMMSDAGLDGALRRNLISQIFSSIRGQEEKAQSLLGQLGTEEDRKIAEESLGMKNGEMASSKAPQKIDQPSEWLEAVASIKPENGSVYQYASQLQNWDSAKIAELSRQFQTMPDDQKRNVAKLVAQNLSYDFAGNAFLGDAVKYLVSNPESKDKKENSNSDDPVQMASSYSVGWVQKDPVAASAWVDSLPAGDAKSWAQKNIANNWIQNDPDAAHQWIASLPASDRKAVEAFVKKGDKP